MGRGSEGAWRQRCGSRAPGAPASHADGPGRRRPCTWMPRCLQPCCAGCSHACTSTCSRWASDPCSTCPSGSCVSSLAPCLSPRCCASGMRFSARVSGVCVGGVDASLLCRVTVPCGSPVALGCAAGMCGLAQERQPSPGPGSSPGEGLPLGGLQSGRLWAESGHVGHMEAHVVGRLGEAVAGRPGGARLCFPRKTWVTDVSALMECGGLDPNPWGLCVASSLSLPSRSAAQTALLSSKVH